jgi:hypothetical protein
MAAIPVRPAAQDPTPYAVRARELKVLAIALLVLAGIGTVVAGLTDASDAVMYFVICPAALLAIGVHFRARQHAGKALAARVLHDDHADVVYLRPFAHDAGLKRGILSGFATDEEQLADAVRPFGDLMAIGRPDERLPLPGAARTYVANDTWKEVVRARLPLAESRPSFSTGFPATSPTGWCASRRTGRPSSFPSRSEPPACAPLCAWPCARPSRRGICLGGRCRAFWADPELAATVSGSRPLPVRLIVVIVLDERATEVDPVIGARRDMQPQLAEVDRHLVARPEQETMHQ